MAPFAATKNPPMKEMRFPKIMPGLVMLIYGFIIKSGSLLDHHVDIEVMHNPK
ncbi:hypothetical protein HDEF_0065 [Candidatus Hamiltonella defensa 5AT (Acyrthosiphon pisum)]|uniref:Uncharacterized protein n=1 Tax=Hamiltonella defensa subsp. Acyrthosiphon pisum (strain 5AT) TaxID=572265 RepID=C4K8K4_HAMD5|nr:hypothetical protein HDEF_0065 [Candidatus Hamiltonella defensa 5AT (Acyrthosiphon pisum)]